MEHHALVSTEIKKGSMVDHRPDMSDDISNGNTTYGFLGVEIHLDKTLLID